MFSPSVNRRAATVGPRIAMDCHGSFTGGEKTVRRERNIPTSGLPERHYGTKR